MCIFDFYSLATFHHYLLENKMEGWTARFELLIVTNLYQTLELFYHLYETMRWKVDSYIVFELNV